MDKAVGQSQRWVSNGYHRITCREPRKQLCQSYLLQPAGPAGERKHLRVAVSAASLAGEHHVAAPEFFHRFAPLPSRLQQATLQRYRGVNNGGGWEAEKQALPRNDTNDSNFSWDYEFSWEDIGV